MKTGVTRWIVKMNRREKVDVEEGLVYNSFDDCGDDVG